MNNATLKDLSFDPIKGTVIEKALLIQVDFQNKNPFMKRATVNKKERALDYPRSAYNTTHRD
jgi:hypothetical protein